MARRRLAYKDRFTDYLINTITEDTTGDSIDNDIQLSPVDRTILPLAVTSSEYTKILSSVMAGSDLLFNDEAHQITWLIWKAAKMSVCQAIVDCIENNEGVQNALSGWLAGNGGSLAGNINTVLPNSVLASNMLPGDYTCDADHRFGMAYAIVDSIHQATEEAFQAIEIITNPLELASELSDNYPIWGAVSTASDIVLWIQETAYEAYQLAWSVTIRDELACQLFCAMLVDEQCQLSFDTIKSVYTDIPGVSVPGFGDWLQWVEFIITLPLTVSETVVKGCSLMGLGALAFGSKIGKYSLGIRSLETVVALAADETNSDHSILCPGCGDDWIKTFDFTIDDQGWIVTPGVSPMRGQYVANTGWTKTNQGVRIRFDLDQLYTITSIKVVYSTTGGGQIFLGRGYGQTTGVDAGNPQIALYSYELSGTDVVADLAGELDAQRLWIYEADGTGIQLTITKVIITGKGTPPP